MKGGVAAATVPWLGGCLTGPSAAVTRFGVLSDTHVTGSESLAGLTSVFRFFKSRQVDAVLHCGDLTDLGSLDQLDVFATAWKGVFDDGTGDYGLALSDHRPLVCRLI